MEILSYPGRASLFNNRSNLIYICIGVGISLGIWLIFKYFYPYPNIGIDSYFYIQDAASNVDAGSWPIGYSKFIRLVGFFSHSPFVLVSIQYAILQLSLLFFFITLRFFYDLRRSTSNMLFVFLFLNPLLLFACNHIMSDILFAGLTVMWIGQLLWIIYLPKPYMVITQAFLILMIFTIRYTALYYPIIATLTFIVCRLSFKWKVAGIALTIILITSFILYTSNKMEAISGFRQFSSAGSWKLANNALYMYEHIYNEDKTVVPPKFKELHTIVQKYFQAPHANVGLLYASEEVTTGSFYSYAYESPLMQYLRLKKGPHVDIFDFKNISPLGPYYKEYGSYLIRKHPLAYLKHVIFPDLVAYIIPFPEIYDFNYSSYYLWDDNKFGKTAKDWFKLTSIMIPKSHIKVRGVILYPWPILLGIIHILFLLTISAFFLFRIYKKIGRIQLYGLVLILIYCLLNCIYMISIAVIVLRFQFSILILEFSFVVLIVDMMLQGKHKDASI